MKVWNWIKSLKVPRLIIEALLIFASVYFALILEADRSIDFEREGLKNQLIKLKNEVKHDYEDALKLFADSIEYDENGEILSGHRLRMKNRLEEYILNLESNSPDSVLEARSILKTSFSGYFLIIEPLTLSAILNSNQHLLLDSNTVWKMYRIKNHYERINNYDESINVYGEEFLKSIDEQVFWRVTLKTKVHDYDKSELYKFLKSPLPYNYLRRLRNYNNLISTSGSNFINDAQDFLLHLDKEIQAQNKEMKGIF